MVKTTIFPIQRMVKPKHDYNFSRSVVYSIPDSEISQTPILKRKDFFVVLSNQGHTGPVKVFFELAERTIRYRYPIDRFVVFFSPLGRKKECGYPIFCYIAYDSH
jgi:hypothetical protein